METFFTLVHLEGFVWMLLHSLWQFAVVGGLVIAISRRMKKATAVSRYRVLGVGLLCMPLMAVLTYQLMIPTEVVETVGLQVNDIQEGGKTQLLQIESVDFATTVESWISAKAIYIFMFWACGILVLGFRMLVGQLQLFQLRAWGQVAIGQKWQRFMTGASKKLGVKTKVHLAESHLVKEPLTFGFLKPVVLFPVGLINRLDPQEVEAILWHELAHVRRHDYLVNLLQTLLETVFYYHPVLWLLNKEIRQVREECCDDLVRQQGVDELVYAESLLRLARLINAQNNQFVMSTNSLNSAVGTRIKRLFLPIGTPARNKPFSALIAVCMILCFTAYTGISLQAQNQVSVELEQMNVLYLDVEHRINVAADGIPSNQLELTSNDLEVIPTSQGHYILKGKKLGEATLEIRGPNGKIREAQYEIRRFPDAVPRLAGQMGGPIWLSELTKVDRLEMYTSTEFPNPCKITSFNITRVEKGKDPEAVGNHTGVFNDRTMALLKKAKSGDIYYFDKLQCQCGKETEERKMPAMVFEINVKETKTEE